jgi:T4 RnlA family RNA ligase
MQILDIDLNKLTHTKPALIKRKQHPHLPISIYNYTEICQFRKHWNPLTLAARGLVVEHETSLIVARPMPKFFNYSENKHTAPKKNFGLSVLEKLDGSLGIWFCYQGEWMMTSRGSFDGQQASEGAKMAKTHGLHKSCDKTKTYCFEIIYPENKIVVNYGKRQELVLLAVIDTATGHDAPNAEVGSIAKRIGVKVARSFDVDDPEVEKLYAVDRLNEEGFVVRFHETGERVKVKFASYLNLAKDKSMKGGYKKSMTYLIRERLLKDPKDMVENNLDSIPDEFFDEARKAQEDFFLLLERTGQDFDNYVLQYQDSDISAVPKDLAGSPMLCKWLRLSKAGKGTPEMRGEIRKEYALRVLRTILGSLAA